MAWEEVEAAAWEAAAARAFSRLLHSGVGWGRVRRGRLPKNSNYILYIRDEIYKI